MIIQTSNLRQIKKQYNDPSLLPYQRLHWIDALRGLTVISMVFYHFMWDLVYIYGADYPWYYGALGNLWQQSICWSFIIISGFCAGLSANTIKRGIIVSVCGIIVTIVTVLASEDLAIWFGVLTLLGASMIITGLLKEVLINIPSLVGLIISAILFFLTREINVGYLGFGSLKIIDLPQYMYQNMFTTFFGFPKDGFYSTDYFSLIPWLFLFLFGFYLQCLYRDVRYDSEGSGKPVFFFGAIGKHSLLIYMLHQPLIYVVLLLLFRFVI